MARSSRFKKIKKTKKTSPSSIGENGEKTFIDECAEIFEAYSLYLAWGILLLSIYLMASILTSWTGIIGHFLADYLLKKFGGAIMIPLLFVVYICLSEILGRKINRLSSEIAGTVVLFLAGSFSLGMLEMTGGGSFQLRCLYAGSMGSTMALWSYRHLGPLGVTLLSIAFFSAIILCFGIQTQCLFEGIVRCKMALFSWWERYRVSGRREKKPLVESMDSNNEAADITEPEEITQNYFSVDIPEKLSLSDECQEESLFDAGDITLQEGDGSIFPPPLEIFGVEKTDENRLDEQKARPWGERIVTSLRDFGIEAELAETLVGPTVIQFRIQLAPGIKVSRVSALSNDLALALAVPSVRVEAPIPGKPYIGIEIPNPKRQGITIRSVLAAMEDSSCEVDLPLPMGVTVDGDALIVGLESLPHLLVAGTTGSGKSVFVNSCIVGLCSNRRPSELRMVLVDPKRVEMAAYERLPHILTPPVTNPKKAVHVLAWALREMQRRYDCFARAGAKNLSMFNEKVIPKDRLPYIVIVVDELADLMMTSPKEVEDYICRLAQMARATGIHLLLATQRPSVNVITGLIKANIPARVAFTLPGSADSRTILDSGGAEKLLGKGDMLFLSTQSPKPIRVQAAWVDERAISVWLDYLIRIFGEAEYINIDEQSGSSSGLHEEADISDPLFEEAVQLVLNTGMASASGLQRRLRVGFTRAARLIDMMEAVGIVGPSEGAKPREILVDEEGALSILNRYQE